MLRSALHSSTAAQPVCWISRTPRYQLHQCTTPLRQQHSRLSKCRSAKSRRLQHLVPDPEADAVAADVLPDLLLDLGVAEDVAEAANTDIAQPIPSSSPAIYSSSGHTDPAPADGSTDWTASDDVDISAASKRLSGAAVSNKQQPQNPVPQPVVSSLRESAPQAWQQAGQQQVLAGSPKAPYASSSSSSSSSSEGGSRTAARAVSWKSAAADAAAAAGVDTPTHSAAHAEVAPGTRHAAGAEPPPPPPAAAAAAAAAAATANSDAGDIAAGGFFSSRASMLQQLRQQQVQVQRTHVMKQHSQQLYRYTVADGDDDSSRIKRQPPSTPVSPVKQTTFPLAKQQPPTHTTASSSSSSSSSSSRGSVAGLQQSAAGGLHAAAAQDDQEEPWLDTQQQQLLHLQQQQGGGPSPPLPSYLQPQHQQHHNAAATETQHHDLTDSATPSRDAVSSSGVTALPLAATRAPPQDPSRGLCLSAFLYCCSRTQLLSLTWQLGLPPSALRIVSRVADADMVLHVKPGPGVRHYDYETYRSQAAAKGIPFIDLKSLSLLELQLYLLPVFRLYAGELSPRDLLLRKKRHGYKTRYTNIKLPPA